MSSFPLSAPVFAQDASAVDAWLQREWKAAASAVLPEDVSLEFVEELQEVPLPAELEALRASVAGHPDHPNRADLEVYERRLAAGPDRTVYRIWYHGPSHWRISQTLEYVADGTGFWDTAHNGSLVWGMSNDQLTLLDAEREAEARRHFAARGAEIMREAWVELVHGNLAFGWFGESTPSVIRIEDGEWEARAVNSAGLIAHWWGRWDADLQRGFVTGLAFRGKESGEPSSDSEWAFKGWHFDEVAGVWIAREVQRTLNDRPKRRITLNGVERTTASNVAVLTSAPDIAGSDPIRGAVTVSRLNDYRSGRAERQWVDTAGEVVHTENIETLQGRKAEVLRWIGWASLAALVGALLWLRAKRSSGG